MRAGDDVTEYQEDLRQIRALVARIIDKPHPDMETHDVLRAISHVCQMAVGDA